MERWTHRMIRLRWAVVAVWAVILVGSVGAMSGLSDLLTNRFSLPGTDTERGERARGALRPEDDRLVRLRAAWLSACLVPEDDGRRRGRLERTPTAKVASVEVVSDDVTATIVSNLEPADARGTPTTWRAIDRRSRGARSTSADKRRSSTISTRCLPTISSWVRC